MRNLPTVPSTSELQPWHSLGGLEHICELNKSCIVLYGIFTELARMIYYDTDGRLTGTPGVLWRTKNTEIWIDSELRWEDQHPEFRPAIYVQLGEIHRQPYIQGINGKVLGTNRFGERTYEMLSSGSVMFMHLAATSGEACALADNTEYNLKMLQDPICRDFCFNSFESSGRIALEKQPKESSDRYASGVSFNYTFDDTWTVKEECPILKQINIINSEEETQYLPLKNPIKENCGRQTTINSANIFTVNKEPGSSRSPKSSKTSR